MVRATQVTRTEIRRALNYLPVDSLYAMGSGMAMGEIASTLGSSTTMGSVHSILRLWF